MGTSTAQPPGTQMYQQGMPGLVCTLRYTSGAYQGTLSKHDHILFHYQTGAANCFCYFYGDDNPCQGEFKGWGAFP